MSTALPGNTRDVSQHSHSSDHGRARDFTRGPREGVVHGTAGDHPHLHRLLVTIFHGPSAAEFHALQDEPLYEPHDRLLVVRDGVTVAHVHRQKRELIFAKHRVLATQLLHLATAVEHREQGLATRLVETSLQEMQRDGSKLAMVRTRAPGFFERCGFVRAFRHSFSIASARGILAYLDEKRETKHNPLQQPLQPLNIRLWRHVEQEALAHLYRQNTSAMYGSQVRNDAYWRWLVSRKSFDQIYVAIDGQDRFALDECCEKIVGYAVVKEGRVLELLCSPEHPRAPTELLARVCADAIEYDFGTIRLDSIPSDPLHEIFKAAGGKFHFQEDDDGQTLMARLLDPIDFLEMLLPEVHQRAVDAGLGLPTEDGIHLENSQKLRLVVGPAVAKIVPGKLGRSYMTCDQGVLSQLLLGHLDVRQGAEQNLLRLSTRIAGETLASLLPPLQAWRPPFDDCPTG